MPSSETIQRRHAIRRGLEFIYRLACDPQNFADYGGDLLSCFYFVSATSRDPELRRAARRMGEERARRWRRDNPSLHADADTQEIMNFIDGSYAADRLGVRDPSLKNRIRKAAARFTARDFLGFDPREEPPPSDLPYKCECGEWNARGRGRCRSCRRSLLKMSRQLVWYDSLVRAYSAARYGVSLGATYADVLKWLPSMRPYRGSEGGDNPDFYHTVYAVTHIVYTLNDYSLYRLSPRWLPREFAFLKENLAEAFALEDAEMVGEFLDALKAFGLSESHPLIRAGVEYLLPQQNADGSWGDPNDEDIYTRYHSTWTAIDGLREYRWRGTGLSFPQLKPLLRRWATDGG
jgi:hypothetical protein